ncbi:hypothetical protein TNCV_1303701 [Trichonephila clavipes]|nr:hypothetical protein TNCV_1303701 [Trichonephila clavipes]
MASGHSLPQVNLSVKGGTQGGSQRASRIVHGCCSDTHRGTSFFSRDFRVNELEAAIDGSCLNKSPDPDGIHGQMIDQLGLSARQRFLYIINCSWNKGQLPRDWRKASHSY